VLLADSVVVKMSEKITKTVPTGTAGRSTLPSKSVSALAIRDWSDAHGDPFR